MKSDFELILIVKAKQLNTTTENVRLALAMKAINMGSVDLSTLIDLKENDLL